MGAFTALAGDLVIHPDSSAWLKKARSRSSFFADDGGASFHAARNSRSRFASSSRRNRTPLPVQNSVKVWDLSRFVSLGGPNNTRYFFSVDAARFRAVASVVNFRMASVTVILSSSDVSTVLATSMSRTTSVARSQFVRSRLLRTGSPATVPRAQIGHQDPRDCLPLATAGGKPAHSSSDPDSCGLDRPRRCPGPRSDTSTVGTACPSRDGGHGLFFSGPN